MISRKSPAEIEIIKANGRMTALILEKVLAAAQPGVKTIELEELANSLLDKFGVQASFKTVKNYQFALCLSLNEEIVHGLPGDRKLKKGDLLSVDSGVLDRGFHSDMARTIVVGEKETKEISRFLAAGKKALRKAIDQARIGNRVGHLSLAIEETVEKAGYSPVEGLVGHGLGRTLHEDPQIPCFLMGKMEETPLLEKGMVLAVEAMYAQGEGAIKIDGWTVRTADGSLAGHFENTIVVTEKGPVVLTKQA